MDLFLLTSFFSCSIQIIIVSPFSPLGRAKSKIASASVATVITDTCSPSVTLPTVIVAALQFSSGSPFSHWIPCNPSIPGSPCSPLGISKSNMYPSPVTIIIIIISLTNGISYPHRIHISLFGINQFISII